jgi:glycosyltransferase involved in cell wall biosynthesis
MNPNLSIILPCLNEAHSLSLLLPQLKQEHPKAEIIVVDDCSTDDSRQVAENEHVKLVKQPYTQGNGAAIKAGARAATGDVLVFMDADGQHKPEDIQRLLNHYHQGYDMVVGARDGGSQANKGRWLANGFYNRFASWMVNQQILDLTSGFRVVERNKFIDFLLLLPNGFSYPTTITMAFFRMGYTVGYLPISTPKRIGKSHIKWLRDGVRFLLIIFKIGTLYSPLKLFFPLSFLFLASGISYYLYSFLTAGRLTNMTTLLLTTAMLIFLIGLVSEQVTQLTYLSAQILHKKNPHD